MAAPLTWEYHLETSPDLETLNALGAEGWELVSVDASIFYFKRPTPDFREQVTLDQKRRYYASWAVEGVE
jgi:hypothetical protein